MIRAGLIVIGIAIGFSAAYADRYMAVPIVALGVSIAADPPVEISTPLSFVLIDARSKFSDRQRQKPTLTHQHGKSP